MKVIIKVQAVFLSAIILLCFCACGKRGDYFDAFAFNSPVHVEVYDKKISETVKADITEHLSELENEFTVKENSFTAKLNDSKNGEIVPFTANSKEVLEKCFECYNISSEKFDPTVFPLVKLWQFYPNFPVIDFTVPSDAEISEIVNSGKIGLNNIQIKKDGVKKINPETQIDFGGILKGYAADNIAKILTDDGHTSGYINLGGSSLYLLSVDSLGIIHPRIDNQNILTVNTKDLKSVSVSTSGDYQKCYKNPDSDNEYFCHIINSKTGKPTDTDVISATVIGKDGAITDGLSTALCLFDYNPQTPKDNPLSQKILELLSTEKYSEYKFIVVYQKGDYKQIITNCNGLLQLHDDSYQIISII